VQIRWWTDQRRNERSDKIGNRSAELSAKRSTIASDTHPKIDKQSPRR
jgi:hypothetical protein